MRKLMLLGLLAVSGTAFAMSALLTGETSRSLGGKVYTVCTYSNGGGQSVVKLHDGITECARSIET